MATLKDTKQERILATSYKRTPRIIKNIVDFSDAKISKENFLHGEP
jgi:hypothetical protein